MGRFWNYFLKNGTVFEKGNISFTLPSIKVYPSHKKTQQNPNLVTSLKLKENNFEFEIWLFAWDIWRWKDNFNEKERVHFRNIILSLGVLLLPFF